MKKVMIILLFAALAFSSCKNQDSKKTSTETDNIETEEEITIHDSESGNVALIAKIKDYITTQYLTESDLRTISEDERKFQFRQIDLNNDGKKEIFVNFMTSYFCGTGGCSILLLNEQIEPITKFTVTRTPLYVEKSMENDWRAIMTQSEGKWRKLIYKGGSYPSNPSVVEITSDAPTESADILFEDNNDLKTYNF